MTEGLKLLRKKLVNLIAKLSSFADEYKSMPCLAFTHFQPAQPTTVGKRATLWAQDVLMDLTALEFQLSQMKLLGSKGTTGTQASFVDLLTATMKNQGSRQKDSRENGLFVLLQRFGSDLFEKA